jgi:hypothetical protein
MDEHEEYLEASRREQEDLATVPHALSARYDRRIGRIVVCLSNGLEISFSPRNAQGLETATWEQLREIEIYPTGSGLHFPALDADLYIPALLEGFFGSKRWMAGRLGATGGRSKSAAKVSAARKNGRAGGRPRKIATVVLAGGS